MNKRSGKKVYLLIFRMEVSYYVINFVNLKLLKKKIEEAISRYQSDAFNGKEISCTNYTSYLPIL